MKIQADRKVLGEVLGLISGVVNPRHTNPLLQNVMFDVTEDGVTLRATDLEVSLQYDLPESVSQKPGRALLPAAKLAGLVRDMRSDVVSMERSGDNVVVTCGRDRIELLSADPDHFPAFPKLTGKGVQEVDAKGFGVALSRTGKSIATERGRYALNGVKITPGPKFWEFCGTDGRRLALARMDGKGDTVNFPVILPRRGVDLFTRMLEKMDSGSSMEVEINENELVARCGGSVISSGLVDGQYPDYWTVIPKGNDKQLKVDRKELLEGVKLASHLTSVESAILAMAISKNEISLRTRSSGTGTAEAVIVAGYEGPEMKVGFDPRYLVEGLNLFQEDEVTFELMNEKTGVIFHDGDKENFFFLVMPLEV